MAKIFRGPHEVIVSILDLAAESNGSVPETYDDLDTSGPFERAKFLIARLVTSKLCFEATDKVSLLTVGTEEADHPMSNKDGYENVSVEVSLGMEHSVLLEALNGLESTKETPGDLLSAVVVAMESVDGYVKGTRGVNAAVARKIALFTDMSTSPFDLEDSDTITQIIKTREYNLLIVACGDERLDTLEDFAQAAGASNIHWSDFVEALKKPRRKRVAPTTKSRVPISFQGHLEIPCYLYLGTKEETIPTAKKESIYADSEESLPPAKAVMSRTYYAKKHVDNQDDQDEEVDMENRAKAYLYGRTLVPVSPALEASLEMPKSEKQLNVIGTIPMETSESCWFVRQCEIVIPEPENASAYAALLVLVRALRKADRVVLARYVWRTNVNPKFVALSPPQEGDDHLVLNYLPFAEDVKMSLELPGLPEPSRQQQDLMNKFVLSMSLVQAKTENAEGAKQVVEIFKPTETCNSALHLFYYYAQERMIKGNEAPLPHPLDPLTKTLQVPTSVFAGTDLVENMKRLFPLVPASIRSEERKKLWRAAQESRKRPVPEITVDDILGESEEKNLKDLHVDPGDIQESFKSMMAKKIPEITEQALEEFLNIIIDKLIESLSHKTLVVEVIDLILLHMESSIEASRPLLFAGLLERVVGVCLVDKSSRPFIKDLLKALKDKKIPSEATEHVKQLESIASGSNTTTQAPPTQLQPVIVDDDDFDDLD